MGEARFSSFSCDTSERSERGERVSARRQPAQRLRSRPKEEPTSEAVRWAFLAERSGSRAQRLKGEVTSWGAKRTHC